MIPVYLYQYSPFNTYPIALINIINSFNLIYIVSQLPIYSIIPKKQLQI